MPEAPIALTSSLAFLLYIPFVHRFFHNSFSRTSYLDIKKNNINFNYFYQQTLILLASGFGFFAQSYESNIEPTIVGVDLAGREEQL